MSSCLFEVFCRTLSRLPTKAISRAADAERQMLEEDLRKQRVTADRETLSVLAFCNFLRAAGHALELSCSVLPEYQSAAYREIVQKLADAGDLPFEAVAWFDHAFSPVSIKVAEPVVG